MNEKISCTTIKQLRKTSLETVLEEFKIFTMDLNQEWMKSEMLRVVSAFMKKDTTLRLGRLSYSYLLEMLMIS